MVTRYIQTDAQSGIVLVYASRLQVATNLSERMRQLQVELQSVHEQLRERTLQLQSQSEGTLKLASAAKSNHEHIAQQAELIKTLSLRCETSVRLCRLFAPRRCGSRIKRGWHQLLDARSPLPHAQESELAAVRSKAAAVAAGAERLERKLQESEAAKAHLHNKVRATERPHSSPLGLAALLCGSVRSRRASGTCSSRSYANAST